MLNSIFYGFANVVSQFLALSVGAQLAILGGLLTAMGALAFLAVVVHRHHAQPIGPFEGYGHEPDRGGEKVVLYVDFEKH